MKLIRIGYWIAADAPEWPDPESFVDPTWDSDERDVVATYLKRGFVVRAWMGYSPCRICGAENGCLELTDGTYVWPDGLAHYVEQHLVRLPAEFVHHAVASLDRYNAAQVDDTWWKQQSPTDSRP
jgi:hypothetical protein